MVTVPSTRTLEGFDERSMATGAVDEPSRITMVAGLELSTLPTEAETTTLPEFDLA